MYVAKYSLSVSRTHTLAHCADSKRKVTLVELRFHLLSVSDLSETVAAAELQHPEVTALLHKVKDSSNKLF